jgi:hypothetical protein
LYFAQEKSLKAFLFKKKKSFTEQEQQVQKFKPECDGNSLNHI